MAHVALESPGVSGAHRTSMRIGSFTPWYTVRSVSLPAGQIESDQMLDRWWQWSRRRIASIDINSQMMPNVSPRSQNSWEKMTGTRKIHQNPKWFAGIFHSHPPNSPRCSETSKVGCDGQGLAGRVEPKAKDGKGSIAAMCEIRWFLCSCEVHLICWICWISKMVFGWTRPCHRVYNPQD